jgi:hypothetical protein
MDRANHIFPRYYHIERGSAEAVEELNSRSVPQIPGCSVVHDPLHAQVLGIV